MANVIHLENYCIKDYSDNNAIFEAKSFTELEQIASEQHLKLELKGKNKKGYEVVEIYSSRKLPLMPHERY